MSGTLDIMSSLFLEASKSRLDGIPEIWRTCSSVLAQPVAGAGGGQFSTKLRCGGGLWKGGTPFPSWTSGALGLPCSLPLVLCQPCPGEGSLLFWCAVSPERMVLRVSVLH